ncbi:sporulation-delaying protein SdpB family protein [Peribacillus sp. NPDC097295]|uniref:sporulation-delaying protein SdpB family protein n=1 Tax=Peribacillus sp. NPDC097295 TaxID=3364402 RepID=UPI00380CCA8B
MIRKLNEYTTTIINNFNPWTNVYGLARSLMGLSLLITFLFNDVTIFFRPSSGQDTITNSGTISLFSLVPQDYFYLSIVKWIFIFILVLVVIGWRPRFTCLLHFYIAYSLNAAGTTIDGGEQVNVVMALLLIPIALTDPRKWHWDTSYIPTNRTTSKIVSFVTYNFIRIQVAILYFHSTIAKLGNTEWVDGTAVYYYMQDTMLGLPSIFKSMANPILSSPLVVIPTWGTIILQTLLVCALFLPKKNWGKMFIFALLFHETIAIMLGLISFSTVMFGTLILYLRPLEQNYKFKFFTYKKNSLEVEV